MSFKEENGVDTKENVAHYYEMFMLQAENYQDSLPEELLRGAEAFYE